MTFLRKLIFLPVALIIEIYTSFFLFIGIPEFRINFFFKDAEFIEAYGFTSRHTLHKIIFAVPLFILLILEIVVIFPIFLCLRIINTIMEVLPILMIIPSFILGFLLGIILFSFNFCNYYMLDADKRSICRPMHFTEIHPATILNKKLSGQA